MKANIPIFIVINTDTEEEKNKSIILLPYAYYYMYKQQFIKRCIIISKDISILKYALKLGFIHIYLEKCNNCNICNIEWNGILHYINDTENKCDWFIKFSIDQPFKSFDLLYQIIKTINNNYDFIVSTSTIQDRSIMYINEDNNFLYNVDNGQRQIRKLPEVNIIDFSLFAVKTSFFIKCCNNTEIQLNAEFYRNFWDGRFLTVKNESMFIQIYKNSHTDRFKEVNDIYQEIQKLPKFDNIYNKQYES